MTGSASRGARIAAIAEIAIGVLFILFLLLGPPQTLVAMWWTAVVAALQSLVALAVVDGAATLWTLILALTKLSLAALPTILLVRAVRAPRRVWLIPLIYLLLIPTSLMSLTACATAGRWLFLVLAVAVSIATSRITLLGWTALLPLLLMFEIVPRHGLLSYEDIGTHDPEYRNVLFQQCRARDGMLPANLDPDRLMPYFGVNSIADDLVLLAAEGPNDGGMRGRSGGRRVGSWWMRRREGSFHFEEPSKATGNLWRGCHLDDAVWMARANSVIGATPPGGERAEETVRYLNLPSSDMDFGDVACDPERHRLFVTEATGGGVWELSTSAENPQRQRIEGLAPLPKRRSDGRLIINHTGGFLVYDPDRHQIIERAPTSFVSFGFDVCPSTGAVATADLAGRLRVFELEGDHYQFRWGVSAFAPRRVAFSRDCSRIAITSADDQHVHFIDVATRSIVESHQAGPALRDVAATGPREFSISDICSMTTYRW